MKISAEIFGDPVTRHGLCWVGVLAEVNCTGAREENLKTFFLLESQS